MEKEGYFCDCIFLNYFFHFSEKEKQKKNKHDSTYFMVNYMIEHRYFYLEYELKGVCHELHKKFNAKPVNKKSTKAELYRIEKAVDDDFRKRYDHIRDEYYAHVMRWELFGAILGLLVCCPMTVYAAKKAASLVFLLLFCLGSIVSLFFSIWNIMHLLRLKNKLYKC